MNSENRLLWEQTTTTYTTITTPTGHWKVTPSVKGPPKRWKRESGGRRTRSTTFDDGRRRRRKIYPNSRDNNRHIDIKLIHTDRSSKCYAYKERLHYCYIVSKNVEVLAHIWNSYVPRYTLKPAAFVSGAECIFPLSHFLSPTLKHSLPFFYTQQTELFKLKCPN